MADYDDSVLPGKARELLPEPTDIFDLSDVKLERIAEDFYDCFNTTQRVEPDGLHPSIVEEIFSKYEHHLSTREHSLPRLRKIMDPKGYGVITEDSFVDGLPFLFRLVQVQQEAEEERIRLMSRLENRAKSAEEKKAETLLKKGPHAGPRFMKPATASSQNIADSDSLSPIQGSQGATRLPRPQSALPRRPSSAAKRRVPLKHCENNNGAGSDGPSCPQKLSSRRSSVEHGEPNNANVQSRRLSCSDCSSYADVSEFPRNFPVAAYTGVHERPRSLAALLVSQKEIICLRRIFEDIDVFRKGFITWVQLRARTPTLPREPVLDGKKLERDEELDFFRFVRIVFPEVPEEDTNVLSLKGAKVRGFVLPQEKEQELQELFCALNGGIISNEVIDTLKPHQLVQGLRDSKYDVLSIAQAYSLLFVEPRDEADITLDQFQAWYCDEILSKKFKALHTKTIKKAATLVAESF